MYAYGVILWELVARDKVFGHVRWLADVAALVLAGQRPAMPPWSPPIYTALIRSCWAQAPSDRPSWSTVIGQLTLMRRQAEELESEWGESMHKGLERRRSERRLEAVRLEEERSRLALATSAQQTALAARFVVQSGREVRGVCVSVTWAHVGRRSAPRALAARRSGRASPKSPATGVATAALIATAEASAARSDASRRRRSALCRCSAACH